MFAVSDPATGGVQVIAMEQLAPAARLEPHVLVSLKEVALLPKNPKLRYKLSFRDLVEMMSERGLHVAHTTIMGWIRRLAPKFIKRWNQFGKTAGRSWRVDEPISRFGVIELISIEPWTRLDGLWTSVSARDGSGRSKGVLSEGNSA